MRDELVARRRDLHAHPELGFEEIRTAGIVAENLTALGLEVQAGVGRTGVVGLLEGASDGPTVLVRADMDALPIQELNEVDYASVTPGKMHACGHDAHTTIALGVAKLLTPYRDRMAGRVKFVFQPAEETVGGAKAMVEDGVLENPRPDVTLGLHLWNSEPVGKVGVGDGPIMAGSSVFRIIIKGFGGHAASPHITIDPVACAAQLIIALQTIVSRNVDPLEQAVVSVTYVRAGDAFNIIPQDVELKGTIRTFKNEVRELVDRRMREISVSLCQAMGCDVEIDIRHNTQPVVNDVQVAERMRSVFRRFGEVVQLDANQRTMGAEDVGFLMQDIPGTYFFVGSANEERGLNYGHHHPRFDFDEDVLPLSVALMASAVADYVLLD
jgi:amidohydrolase